MSASDFTITKLGVSGTPSPIKLSTHLGDSLANYVRDDERVLYDIDFTLDTISESLPLRGLLERAGPREQIFFEPQEVYAGIVTCGGLCPGLNNVIRSIVMTLWYSYGVRQISGIQYGYGRLFPFSPHPVLKLQPDAVRDIHREGGTILGSSKGNGEHARELTDAIERLNLNMLFTIGGDGTLRGALGIAGELLRRNKGIDGNRRATH